MVVKVDALKCDGIEPTPPLVRSTPTASHSAVISANTFDTTAARSGSSACVRVGRRCVFESTCVRSSRRVVVRKVRSLEGPSVTH